MAYAFRLKAKTLRHSHPFALPALTSKLADAKNIPWRCYGGSALLESCNSSAVDIDGDGIASNDTGDSAFKGSGADDTVSTKSRFDKLTSSLNGKLRAKAIVGGHDEKGYGLFEGQVDNPSTKDTGKSDKWQKVVSNARTFALKNKLKATAAGNSRLGLPLNMEAEDRQDFSDLDLSEAEGEPCVFRPANSTSSSSVSSRIDAFQKDLKERTQLSLQEKPITSLSSYSSGDDITSSMRPHISESSPASVSSEADSPMGNVISKLKLSNSRERDNMKQMDVVRGDGNYTKVGSGRDSALSPRAAQSGGHQPSLNQSRSDDTTQGKDSGDDLPVQKAYPSLNEAMSQPLQNDSSAPPHSNYMVCVHDLPSSSDSALIKSSMSIYGEVSGIYKKVRDSVFSAYVQFKTQQGMDTAIAARKLQLGASSFNIVRTDPVFSTVVRLAKVSADTTEKQLLSVCGKYGSIDTVRNRSNGIYDVFYQVQEVSNMVSILGSLNEVTLNRSTWSAMPAPTLHPSVQRNVLKTPEGKAWRGTQVQQALIRMELGMDGMWVLYEDLKRLTALGKEFIKT